MTRWVRGIYEALKPLETLPVEGLVRIWAHEALRLFQDRLVYDEERMWTDENVNLVAVKHFPNVDSKVCLCVRTCGCISYVYYLLKFTLLCRYVRVSMYMYVLGLPSLLVKLYICRHVYKHFCSCKLLILILSLYR